MEWQQLIGFYHVVQSGGFTKAAKITYRTQSALTQQIQKLEEEFDCQLLERIGKRKILLTTAGEKMFNFAEELVTNYEVLVEEINNLKGLHKGRLRIAAPFTTLSQLLPPKIESFMKQFPQVELSLFDRPQNNVHELILEGEADIGVTLESIAPANFTKVRWRKVETVIMIPLGHPLMDMTEVSLDQIAQCPLILPPKDSIPRRKLDKHFEENGLTYRVAMESSNIELSAIYVEMGLGISFATVVRNLPAFEHRNFRFLSLDHNFEADYLTLIYLKEKANNPFLNAFVNEISFNELGV
jgi:DNA-binding transcriptional LysR family regulator